MNVSRTKVLIAAFLVPFLVIVVSVVATFLPSRLVSPAHDFLYSVSGGAYGHYSSFHVEDGKLVKESYPYPSTEPNVKITDPTLYIYRVSSGSSERVSYEGVVQSGARIRPGISSDGYEVSQDFGPSDAFGFLFGGYRSYEPGTVLIRSKFFSKKVSLFPDTSPYYYPHVLGWLE